MIILKKFLCEKCLCWHEKELLWYITTKLIKNLIYENFETIKLPNQFTFEKNENSIKSNISKIKYKQLVKKAKNYIEKGIFSSGTQPKVWKKD